jgi:putative tryptophan/tyrosine transport system substrate-binding protein
MTSERRQFLAVLGGAAFIWPLAASAQQRPLPRVGILDPGLEHLFVAFFAGMRELGYIDGQSVVYVERSAEGRAEAIPKLAAELATANVDVIVTAAGQPTRAAMKQSTAIPIVFAALGDAIAAGVVNSLAHPDRNATGLSFLNTEVSGKRIEILRDAMPKLRRLAILWDRSSVTRDLDDSLNLTRSLGLDPHPFEVGTPEEFEQAFKGAAGQADAVNVLASPFFNASRKRLVALAAQYRLPAMYETDEYMRDGGLISYGPSLADLFRRSAGYVDKILKGARPADLPVEQPTKFQLVINLKTAKALGLAVPQSLLARADEVIE